MALLLGLLTSVATLATAAAPIAREDSLAAGACPALAQVALEQPAVAGDVRAALAVHGAVVRWDLAAGPIRLWVQPRVGPIVDWNRSPAAWTDAVLSAARSWRGIVPGLEFRAERDSAAADVIVTWVDERSLSGSASPGLSSGTAGRTELTDTNGRATTARVRLALGSADGATYDVADIRAVARHELGHVMGLAHHAASKSVMAARVQADRLHPGDAAALRVLYALPMGARCDATRQPATVATTPARH
jgi:hypothetical protein